MTSLCEGREGGRVTDRGLKEWKKKDREGFKEVGYASQVGLTRVESGSRLKQTGNKSGFNL